MTTPSPVYGPCMGWGWGGQQYTQQPYQAGTLVVDMVDARNRKLVWRGSVQNAVGDLFPIAAQLPKEAERIS